MVGLAGYKTISILFLILVAALAGGSPVFATDGASITLTPTSACPGAEVSLVGDFPFSTSPVATSYLLKMVLTSDPGGLVATSDCTVGDNAGILVRCLLQLSDSASCGRYTVTVTLTEDLAGIAQTFGSASAVFTVPSTCSSCAAVGGCVQPVNTFALLSPWMAVIGLVGCIGTVVVVAKKRQP